MGRAGALQTVTPSLGGGRYKRGRKARPAFRRQGVLGGAFSREVCFGVVWWWWWHSVQAMSQGAPDKLLFNPPPRTSAVRPFRFATLCPLPRTHAE